MYSRREISSWVLPAVLHFGFAVLIAPSLALAAPAAAPILNQPANMTVLEGGTANQTLTATDPDGDPLTFSKVAGPLFMTVTTTAATTGNVRTQISRARSRPSSSRPFDSGPGSPIGASRWSRSAAPSISPP